MRPRLAGWIGVVIYFLFITAVAAAILFGEGYAVLTVAKWLARPSKLPGRTPISHRSLTGLHLISYQTRKHMKERASLIGGTFILESAPGKGTNIHVRLPARVKRKRKVIEAVLETNWTPEC